MNTHISNQDHAQQNNRVANIAGREKESVDTFGITREAVTVNNVASGDMQRMASCNGRSAYIAQLKSVANSSPQVKANAQLQNIANQFAGDPIQKQENKTGLPDNLKTGIENLSGIDISNTKVHYDSPKPAQLQAHAYTQGTDIHVAPGQERHLAHEAWHVVQQKQGRVAATTRIQGASINDEAALENEADSMGDKAQGSDLMDALSGAGDNAPLGGPKGWKSSPSTTIVQRVAKVDSVPDREIVTVELASLGVDIAIQLMDGIGATTIRDLSSALILKLMTHTGALHLIDVILNLSKPEITQLGGYADTHPAIAFAAFMGKSHADIKSLLPLVAVDPTITSTTAFAAPDASPNTRTTIGVGEVVDFKGNQVGNWSADHGEPDTKADHVDFKWTAPSRAKTVNIKLKSKVIVEKEATKIMTVIEPGGNVTADKTGGLPHTPGKAGAGMLLNFVYHPDNVSFGNIEVKEASGPGSNVTGFFTTINSYHDSGDTFTKVAEDNKDTGEDTAGAPELDGPYSDGTLDWVIPNHFKVSGEGADKHFANVTQSFRMWASGKMRIDKAGQFDEREP